MSDLSDHPFTKLKLPHGETVEWTAADRTFHRSGDYALLITQDALYLYSPFWLWLARWHRIAFSDISAVEFHDSRWRPRLWIGLISGSRTFGTPYGASDEMDYDRGVLSEAANRVAARLASPPINVEC